MPSVFDASAMLALARGEHGADVVQAALARPGNRCYAHHENLFEVYDVTARRSGEDAAALVVTELLSTAGIVPFANPDLDFVWEAARLHVRMQSEGSGSSRADCYAMATARALGCELLTADREDFTAAAAAGLCQVRLIR